MERRTKRMREIRKKRRKHLTMVTLVVFMLCCVIGYKKIDLTSKEANQSKKLEELKKTMQEEEKRKDEIDEYETYVASEEFIEQEARDKLGLVYPNEIVFEAEE